MKEKNYLCTLLSHYTFLRVTKLLEIKKNNIKS